MSSQVSVYLQGVYTLDLTKWFLPSLGTSTFQAMLVPYAASMQQLLLHELSCLQTSSNMAEAC